jgi:transmembrane sensor
MVFLGASGVLYIVHGGNNEYHKEMKELFVKYIKRQCTKKEVQQIVSYFKNSQDLSDVPTIEAVYDLLNEYPDIQEDVANRIKKNVLEVAKNNQKKSFSKKYHLLKYAAVAVLLLGLGHFYRQGYFSKKPALIIPPESITLASENGDIKIINEAGSAKVVDDKGGIVGVQEGNQLVYNNSVTKNELVYNTLTVPYGKRFKIQLSDGTVVYLNSGTSLKHPIAFIQGENRHVFLNGEAFFDVATDKEHPLIVNAEALNIEVIGTKFNVSAYPEDLTTEVVLVEGSVGLYNEKEVLKDGITIVPGTKGSLEKEKKQISTEKVNIEIYTQWMKGGLVFRNNSFENISKKLERHFNVKINNTNELLTKEIFNASFKEEPIEIILNDFKNSFDFKYKIEENTIYIN